MSDERANELGQHLRDHLRETMPRQFAEDTVRAILADPQAHVDALVAAGVLEKEPFMVNNHQAYRVVQPEPPHVHKWTVAKIEEYHTGNLLIIICECGDWKRVQNEVPIEVESA